MVHMGFGGSLTPIYNIYTHFVLAFLLIIHHFILFLGMTSSSSVAAAAVAANAVSIDTSTAVLIRVDQSGDGDYKKIQEAIDAIPSDNTELVFILVKPGTYREKIVVPANKPYITLSGSQASNTIIAWNDGQDINESSTLTVLASDFVGRYLTIENTYGKAGPGVALRVSGDKAAFYNCRIISYQDTLFDDGGRHYYSNCYIEGATDFICGNAASLYEKCHLHSVKEEGVGSITAQKRESPRENTGFTFLGCKITAIGVGTTILGRPWGPYSRVVYMYTYMSGAVFPEGWDDWGTPARQSTVLYGEYKCYGPGANRSKRVKWSQELTSQEATPYLTKDMIGGRGWLRPTPARFKRGCNTTNNVNIAINTEENKFK